MVSDTSVVVISLMESSRGEIVQKYVINPDNYNWIHDIILDSKHAGAKPYNCVIAV